MKNVLILSDINFWEDSAGHCKRLKALIDFLSSRTNLTVVNTGPAPLHIEDTLKMIFSANFKILEYKRFMTSAGYGKRLEKFMKTKEFDAVIVEYIHSSYFLNFLHGRPKIILDLHDIIGQRAEEFKKFNYTNVPYELPASTELQIMNTYDYVMAICDADKAKLDMLLRPDKVLLCPHPASVTNLKLSAQVKHIVFVASAYLPNRDAINHFIKTCWPSVSAKYPQILLIVYGTICPYVDFNGHSNIALKGFVPDLNRIYQNADIIINPVRFGSGIKIKNIEALGHGVPLITTTHGARGLTAIANRGFIIADSPSEFVEALSLLIENIQVRKRLSRIAHEFTATNLSSEKCFMPLLEALELN